MHLQWRDFDFAGLTLLIQRSIVHGRVGDVKTEYSRDSVPLDTAWSRLLMLHQGAVLLYAGGVVVRQSGHREAVPPGGDPEEAHPQSRYRSRDRRTDIGWHTFRHSYRSWLDETGAPLTVQKELMRHASIQTTMNIYGKAMTDSKRQAHSKVVEMVLNSSKSEEIAASRSRSLLLGVNGSLWYAQNPCNRLKRLVAGEGFEPSTFGL